MQQYEMPAACLRAMYLEPANRDLREALTNGSMARMCPREWSLEIVEKFGTLYKFLCHLWAWTMLIFFLSFQF